MPPELSLADVVNKRKPSLLTRFKRWLRRVADWIS